MVDPLRAITVASLLMGAIALLIWPRHGILARLERIRMHTSRVLIEDALKHLHECEYQGLVCTRQSISGALEISRDATTRLLERLQSLQLVVPAGQGYALTSEGRSYALRIVRIHRLWELYLADKTGMDEIEWHEEAERREHVTSIDEADALSSQMGHPCFDPHGDPIPSATGDMPALGGGPLTEYNQGTTVRILHIEDEPRAIYGQIVGAGLHPGMIVRIQGASRKSLLVEANGRAIELTPQQASNVTAERTADKPEPSYDSLASLRAGEKARVIGISKRCRGLQRRRLMDLGIVPGTVVTADMRSTVGDPTAYTIRGTLIAIRRAQASLVQVERLDNEGAA